MKSVMMVLFTLIPALAQQPPVLNAKASTRSASTGLEATFRAIAPAQSGPMWVGYAVPYLRERGQISCVNMLENVQLENVRGPVIKLEPPQTATILYRVEQGKVGAIRKFAPDCQLDAGGLPFYWLTDVRPSDSVAWLASFVNSQAAPVPGGDRRDVTRLSDGALSAIGWHADDSAASALEKFAAGQPENQRLRAVSLLGYHGRRGFEALKKIATSSPDDKLRQRAMRGLLDSKTTEAVTVVTGIARDDKAGRIRGEALVLLAERVGKDAVPAIQYAIENERDQEVQRRAISAMERLPSEDAVPLLIQVARKNSNQQMRRQAMNWLGRSGDARARSFIEDVLK